MNHTEQLLLAVCVGSIAGSAIGNLIYLASLIIADLKDKKRKKERDKERAALDDPLDIF